MSVSVDEPLQMPSLRAQPAADGWAEETLRYRVRPRDKPKFHTVLDAKTVFGPGSGGLSVVTRARLEPVEGETALELAVTLDLGGVHLEDRLDCLWSPGLVAGRLNRVVGEARKKDIDFPKSPFPLPATTYPEVLLPFLLRGQPMDGERRAVHAWTSDRFVARVYYESRGTKSIEVPAGRLPATEVWMYPDLNDWVKLGSVLTRMAKPFLPRYGMWFDAEEPRRLLRFEGSYGPPGAPEIIIELVE